MCDVLLGISVYIRDSPTVFMQLRHELQVVGSAGPCNYRPLT